MRCQIQFPTCMSKTIFELRQNVHTRVYFANHIIDNKTFVVGKKKTFVVGKNTFVQNNNKYQTLLNIS